MEQQAHTSDNALRTNHNGSLILEEEDYLDEMGKIIERDFFPNLHQYKNLETPPEFEPGRLPFETNSPATFDTPKQVTTNVGTVVQEEFKKPFLSLNKFCKAVKNRENENFIKILAKSEQKRKESKGWMYQVADMDVTERLKVPSIEEQAKMKDRPLQVDTWAHTVHNPFMFQPQGVFHRENHDKEQGQEIVYTNTYFKNEPFDEKQSHDFIQKLAMNHNQNLMLEEKIGIDGKIITPKPSNSCHSYVQFTPSPRPGYDASPLMTYGQLDSTPMRVERESTYTGSRFSLAPVPKREIIALKLEKAASKKIKTRIAPNISKEWSRRAMSPRSIFSDRTPNTPKEKGIMSLLRRGAPLSPWDRPRSDIKTWRGARTPSVSSLGISFRPRSSTSDAQRDTKQDLTDNLLQLPLLQGLNQFSEDKA